ncbi:MAG: class I SAM-dependent methyltransferase [Phycisphaerales bacterium]
MPPRKPNRSDLRSKIEQELREPGSRSGDEFRPRSGGGVRPGSRPPLRMMTTTLWEYPSQHYDAKFSRTQGSKDYVGATPSWVIWQLLQRYTREGDTVVDPMCGSGTTLDVCEDLKRNGLGFDLNPQRPQIALADARELPVEDEAADFVFIDPPYSTHVDYSDDERCIGKLDAAAEMEEDDVMTGHAYYEAMDGVISEIHRVLRPNRYMGLYVSDSWKKQKGTKGGVFMPIGFELFAIMRGYFEPVDIIAVVRHNKKLNRGNWHKAAEKENFFLRGFNYLFIMKKVGERAGR